MADTPVVIALPPQKPEIAYSTSIPSQPANPPSSEDVAAAARFASNVTWNYQGEKANEAGLAEAHKYYARVSKAEPAFRPTWADEILQKVDSLKDDVKELKDNVKELKDDVKELKKDVEVMKETLAESNTA
ncbi:hypothetical protein VKT23_001399 [Stygiomarasmius scandens]|uniref:Uncharacterized protein n=1 Tax=Marasmiellus scandens TaxID=2682957 RepID=A0ABR1JZE0_9AGAR